MHLIQGCNHLLRSPLYRSCGHLSRPNSLPYTFRKLRIHRNLTKKSLAHKFGFTEEYVSAIESGSKFPSLRYCLLCADEFGASVGWVKSKWANEAIKRFSARLMVRLGLD